LSNSKNIPVTGAEMRRSTVRHSSAYFELFCTLKLISLQRNEFLWFQKFRKNKQRKCLFPYGIDLLRRLQLQEIYS